MSHIANQIVAEYEREKAEGAYEGTEDERAERIHAEMLAEDTEIEGGLVGELQDAIDTEPMDLLGKEEPNELGHKEGCDCADCHAHYGKVSR